MNRVFPFLFSPAAVLIVIVIQMEKYYKAIYDIAKSKGLIDKYGIVWGGNWKQKDSVHFQLGTADNIQFRR